MPASPSCLRGALVPLLLSSAVAPGPEFSFEKFKDTYVRDGTGPPSLPRPRPLDRAASQPQLTCPCSCPGLAHPRDDPKSNPEHEVHPPAASPLAATPVPIPVPRAQDFDPFHIPMPVVAPGVTAETAFAELDADGDGIIRGEEFAKIPKSENFKSISREEMNADYAVFGMSKELFKKRHAHENVEKMEEVFSFHDEDGNDMLFKKEYEAAVVRPPRPPGPSAAAAAAPALAPSSAAAAAPAAPPAAAAAAAAPLSVPRRVRVRALSNGCGAEKCEGALHMLAAVRRVAVGSGYCLGAFQPPLAHRLTCQNTAKDPPNSPKFRPKFRASASLRGVHGARIKAGPAVTTRHRVSAGPTRKASMRRVGTESMPAPAKSL
eukprot:COSAG04_NODE_4176_length_2252_cov_21.631677_2_plen_377_part_00